MSDFHSITPYGSKVCHGSVTGVTLAQTLHVPSIPSFTSFVVSMNADAFSAGVRDAMTLLLENSKTKPSHFCAHLAQSGVGPNKATKHCM